MGLAGVSFFCGVGGFAGLSLEVAGSVFSFGGFCGCLGDVCLGDVVFSFALGFSVLGDFWVGGGVAANFESVGFSLAVFFVCVFGAEVEVWFCDASPLLVAGLAAAD